MKEDFPVATRAEYLSGDVTPKIRCVIKRTRLDFGDVLISMNDAGVIDDNLNPPGEVKVGTFDKSTSGAPVSQSITDVGFKPTLVFMWCTRQISLDTLATYNFGSHGMACQDSDDTIYQSAYGWQSEDNQGISDTDMTASATEVLKALNTAGVVLVAGTLTSFDENGFTINWTTNDASAYKIGYAAIRVGNYTATRQLIKTWATQTGTGSQPITGVGFLPEFLFNIGGGTLNMPGTRATYYVGVGAVGPGLGQFGSGMASLSGSIYTYGHFVQDAGLLHYMPNSAAVPSIRNRFDLTGYDADGFTVDHITNAGFAYYHNALAMRDWNNIYVDEFTHPQAAGDQSVTGVGFQPDIVLFFQNAYADGPGVGGPANMTFGAMDSSGRMALSMTYDDRSDPSDTARYCSSNYCIAAMNSTNPANDPTSLGKYVSMDADGFTVHWTLNGAEFARQIHYIAIKVTA